MALAAGVAHVALVAEVLPVATLPAVVEGALVADAEVRVRLVLGRRTGNLLHRPRQAVVLRDGERLLAVTVCGRQVSGPIGSDLYVTVQKQRALVDCVRLALGAEGLAAVIARRAVRGDKSVLGAVVDGVRVERGGAEAAR